MIADGSEQRIVSSLGWVDGPALWCLDVGSDPLQPRSIPISDASHLSLHAGREDHFAVVHHYDAGQVRISVHHFASPGESLSEISVRAGDLQRHGDAGVWLNVPRAYTAYHAPPGFEAYHLILIDRAGGSVELQQFDWFDETYDHGYQGIVGVTEVPGEDLLIVSVQRDSNPVLYDPIRRAAIGRISLAGRRGNAALRYRDDGGELWAVDYDTVVRLEPGSWRIRDSLQVEEAAAGTAQFVGDLAFDRSGRLAVVARPFAGEVVAIDTGSFRVTHHAPMGRQPLEVAAFQDGRVFARDWKSGDLVTGRLQRLDGR